MRTKFDGIIKSVEKGFKQTGKLIDKYSPEILIGCGIVGFISTVVLVAKEAPKAERKLEDLHEELAESDEELTNFKIAIKEFKTVLPVYAPAIISGTVSVGCILSSYSINSKRTAAWATAYELTQASFIEYKDKVKEQIGEKKEREIQHEINHDHIYKDPPPESITYSNDVLMGDGTELYCFRGHYFRIKRDDIFNACIIINNRLRVEDWIPLSELYWELGIRDYDGDEGDDYGFKTDDILIPKFDPDIAPDGSSCQTIWLDDELPILKVGYKYR